MRDSNQNLSKPKKALVDVAEQLFAERGFEGVSVRDITQGAKANVAAVNYHFGSREELVGLVMLRSVAPINEERILRLDKVERQYAGKVLPLEEVLDAWIRPLMATVRKSEISDVLFSKLIGRVYSQQGQDLPAELESQLKTVNDRFFKAFSKALPDLGAEELVWRIQFTSGALYQLLIQYEACQQLAQGSAGSPTMEATLSRLIRYAAAGMRNGLDAAPASPEKKKGPQATFDF